MVRYIGNGEYQFTKTNGEKIIMTVQDIEQFMICMDEYVSKLLESKPTDLLLALNLE